FFLHHHPTLRLYPLSLHDALPILDFIFTKTGIARWGMNRILSRGQVGTGIQPFNHTEIMPAIFRSYFLIMATRECHFSQINSKRRTLLADRLLSITIQMITGLNLQEIREN